MDKFQVSCEFIQVKFNCNREFRFPDLPLTIESAGELVAELVQQIKMWPKVYVDNPGKPKVVIL